MSELTIFEKAGAEEEICKFVDPKNQATKEELKFFFEICKSRNLNPYLKEVYFVKYGNQNAAIIIGVDTFISRANEHEDYMGFKSGWIIINEEGKPVKTEIPHGELYGAWCEVHRKNKVPLTQTVVFSEFSTGRNRWHSAPFQMIDKVAQATAHRKAYPKSFQHLYGWEEMDQAKDGIKIEEKDDDIVDPVIPTPKAVNEDSTVSKLVEKLELTHEKTDELDYQSMPPTKHVTDFLENSANAEFIEAYHAPQQILDATEDSPEKYLMKLMIKSLNMEKLKECWEKDVIPQFETNENIDATGKRTLGDFKNKMKLRIEADKEIPFGAESGKTF